MTNKLLFLVGIGALLVLILISAPLNAFAVSNNTNTHPIQIGANKFDCSPHAKGCGGLS